MRVATVFAFVVLTTVLGASNAEESVKKDLFAQDLKKATINDNNAPSMSTDNDERDEKGVLQPKCTPTVCPRIYKPICASVDGIPLTAPTMCHYNDKIRCYNIIRRPGERMPVFKLLHEGVCNGSEPNILRQNVPVKRPPPQG